MGNAPACGMFRGEGIWKREAEQRVGIAMETLTLFESSPNEETMSSYSTRAVPTQPTTGTHAAGDELARRESKAWLDAVTPCCGGGRRYRRRSPTRRLLDRQKTRISSGIEQVM